MKLIQEISNQVNEAPADVFSHEKQRLKRVWQLIDRDFEHLRAVFRENSSSMAIADKLGGDMLLAATIREKLDELNDLVDDFHMTTWINHQDNM